MGPHGKMRRPVAIVPPARALAFLLLVVSAFGALPSLALGAGCASTRAASTTSTTVETLERQSIGASVDGRPMELFSLGRGPRQVLVIGGVHGDEAGGPVARQLVDYLKEHPGALPVGVRLQVVPSANPDGEAAGTRGNANGVDLNRNFPSNDWSPVLDAEDRPSVGLTGGAGPASEPETQALLGCLEGCDLVITLHSSGGIIDYDGEGGLALARRISRLSGLPVAHLDYQEHVTGSLGTYVPERYDVPVITVELGGADLTAELRSALLDVLGEE